MRLLLLALLLAACAPPVGDAAPPSAAPSSAAPIASASPAVAPPPSPTPEALAVERSWRRVVLDAGHGGEDDGAIGVSGSREKDVVLSVAREAARQLRSRGFQVILTRDDDTTLSLPARAALTNASGAGLFVSLHANAAETDRALGIETYSADLTADEASMRLAERENRAASVEGGARDDLAVVIDELRMGGMAKLSRAFADRVHRSLLSGLRDLYGAETITDRGVKQAPFWVLLDTECPAILVEVGYLTHPHEEKRVRTRGYHHQIAVALADGVARFAETMDPTPQVAGKAP